MAKRQQTLSSQVGYLCGLVESQTTQLNKLDKQLIDHLKEEMEEMQIMKDDIRSLKEDAAFRRKIRKGIMSAALFVAAIWGALKAGNLESLWK